jgi:ferredoxin
MSPPDTRNETITLLHSCHDFSAVIFLVYNAKESKKRLAYLDVKRIQACMQLCQSTADFLLQRLPLADKMCEICAAICEQCAVSFASSDDEQLRQFAGICKNTVGACMSESYGLKSHAPATTLNQAPA